jgi:hypothetical protein
MKKKILLLAAFAAFFFIGLAQVPDAFNYQAVVRNNSGEVMANQNVSFRISILQGSESGSVLYAETHTVSTNAFGLVNLKVGNGTLVSGVFSPDGWGATSHFLKVEIDPAGGSTYTHLGTSELLAVPYAFHAKTVEDDAVDDADADPTNEIQTLSLSGSDLTLSDGGGTVTLPASTGGDNWGTQTVASNATLSGDGTSGDPLGVVGDLTDDQNLTLVGNDLSITDGNTVTIPGDDWGAQAVESDATLTGVGTSGDPLGVVGDLTDNQTLSVSGNDLTISEGNTVTLPGDDWGSQAVVSNSSLSGNGTSGSPLGVNGDLTDDQTLSIAGDNLSISNGNSVNIGAADNQTLSVAGNNLSISNGNTVGLPTSPWSISGSNVYYNTGNVGIGTSSPAYNLVINGSTNSYLRFYNSSSGTTSSDGFLVGSQSAGSPAWIWNYENSNLSFATNNQNRMRILANGEVQIVNQLNLHSDGATGAALRVNNSEALWYDGTYFSWGYGADHNYFAKPVGIGTSNPNAMLEVYRNSGSYMQTSLADGKSYHTLRAGSHTWTAGLSFSTGGDWYMIEADGSSIFQIHRTGTINIYGDPVYLRNTYNNPISSGRDLYISSIGELGYLSSSIKYKTNIRPMGDFSSRIFDLSPVLYDAKNGDEKDLVGLIAEDVEKVMPELVSYSEGGEIETVYYSKLVPLLLNEIIKLKSEIDNLKEKLED